MKIEANKHGIIELREVFNSVVFVTEEGEKLAVCMRDGCLEIGSKDTSVKLPQEAGDAEYYNWYRVEGGIVEPLPVVTCSLGLSEKLDFMGSVDKAEEDLA